MKIITLCPSRTHSLENHDKILSGQLLIDRLPNNFGPSLSVIDFKPSKHNVQLHSTSKIHPQFQNEKRPFRIAKEKCSLKPPTLLFLEPIKFIPCQKHKVPFSHQAEMYLFLYSEMRLQILCPSIIGTGKVLVMQHPGPSDYIPV